jgi:undecaprenyl-diphosphatase
MAAVGAASIFNTIIKVTVHRARPVDDLYTGWSNFSFPSGHSTENAVLYGFLAFLVCRNLPPARRIGVAFAAAVLIILIAFSRVYLGAHWFSDVAGGLAFAMTWLTLLSIAYLHHGSSDDRTEGVLIVVAIVFAAAGGLNVIRHHQPDTERYAVKYDVPIIQVADWWKKGWQDLPASRVDLTGETEEPFTLQWAGSLEGLKSALEGAGWQVPAAWSTGSALRWFAPTTPLQLPVFSHPERGTMPSLTLTRANATHDDSSRYVLRVWRTDRQLNDNLHTELWLGSVVEEALSRRLSLVTYPVTKDSFDRPRNVLSQALAVSRLASRGGAFFDAAWDGQVLLSRDPGLPID